MNFGRPIFHYIYIYIYSCFPYIAGEKLKERFSFNSWKNQCQKYELETFYHKRFIQPYPYIESLSIKRIKFHLQKYFKKGINTFTKLISVQN